MSKFATYLALPPDLSGAWAYASAEGACLWAQTDAEKSALSEHSDMTLILAGENVRRYQLDLSGLRGRELRSAIEFELEDRLGRTVSDELICQDRKHAGDVAVVSDDYAQQLKGLLTQYQITPVRIVADYEAVGEGHNLQLGDRLIKGGPDGYVFSEDWSGLLPDGSIYTETQPDELFELFRKRLSKQDEPCFDLNAGFGLNATNSLLGNAGQKLPQFSGRSSFCP